MQPTDGIRRRIESADIRREGYGWTYQEYALQTVCCDIGNINHQHYPEYDTIVTADSLYADYPIVRIPTCGCPRIWSEKEPTRLLETIDGDKEYYDIEPSVGHILFALLPEDVDSLVSLDSAFIVLQVGNVSKSWTGMTVSIPAIGFEATYMLTATTDSTDTTGGPPLNPEFRIDLGEYAGQLTGLHGVEVLLTSTTPGSRFDVQAGYDAEDTRPRIELHGLVRRVNRFGDYTLAYEHDDLMLQATVRAKVDDMLHSANELSEDSLMGFARHTQIRRTFGADYRVLRNETTIGNPYSPLRVDSSLVRPIRPDAGAGPQ